MVYVGGREAAIVGEMSSGPNMPSSPSVVDERALVVSAMVGPESVVGGLIIKDGVDILFGSACAEMTLMILVILVILVIAKRLNGRVLRYRYIAYREKF